MYVCHLRALACPSRTSTVCVCVRTRSCSGIHVTPVCLREGVCRRAVDSMYKPKNCKSMRLCVCVCVCRYQYLRACARVCVHAHHICVYVFLCR